MAYRKNNDHSIHLGLVGDVMIGRSVNEQLREYPQHNLWGTILPELQRQDMVIANLETAITTHDVAVPKVFNFKTDLSHVSVLQQAHIGIVNLANNHVLDYGEPGLKETLQTLERSGISYVGVGINEAQARKPHIFTLNNTRFALLGATDNEPSWIAGPTKPGTNYITIGDAQLLEEIKAIRPSVDIVIVTLHWGPNMKEYPSQAFIDYAHTMVDAGADIIAGHSAHVIQGIELYKNALILYDMGDFIDDYIVHADLRNDLTALFSVQIKDKKITSLTLIPARIKNMVVNRAHEQDAQEVFDLIKKRSRLFNTTFHETNGALRITK